MMANTHSSSPTPQPPPLPVPPVDDELLRELHAANERLREAREAREAIVSGSYFRYQERLDQANQQFRDAERNLEEVTKPIESNLHLPPPPTAG